ncbi:MAG: branched-chain amino acid transporter permease [Lachnospiraceae bacterium]
MNWEHSIWIIAVCALTTLVIRALPFLVFGGKKEVPKIIRYLGEVLPCAIMAVLVVYCLKGISLFTGNHGLPQLLAVALVVALHLWKRNTLLSIGLGTAFYMVLVQVIFV